MLSILMQTVPATPTTPTEFGVFGAALAVVFVMANIIWKLVDVYVSKFLGTKPGQSLECNADHKAVISDLHLVKATISGLDQRFTLELGKLTTSMTSMSDSAAKLANTAADMAKQQAIMLERGNSHQTQLLERLTNVLETIKHSNHRAD